MDRLSLILPCEDALRTCLEIACALVRHLLRPLRHLLLLVLPMRIRISEPRDCTNTAGRSGWRQEIWWEVALNARKSSDASCGLVSLCSFRHRKLYWSRTCLETSARELSQ